MLKCDVIFGGIEYCLGSRKKGFVSFDLADSIIYLTDSRIGKNTVSSPFPYLHKEKIKIKINDFKYFKIILFPLITQN